MGSKNTTGDRMSPAVITTRDRQGRLEELLCEAGIAVHHVPLIEIVDLQSERELTALSTALHDLAKFDWLVVTSVHGAERVGPHVAALPNLRLAAVGTRTAAHLSELAGRPVDIVPQRQTGADLVSVLPSRPGERVLIAQADRAPSTVADGLRSKGYDVTAVVAYHTVLRQPNRSQLQQLRQADAVAFASSSAVEAWVDTVGILTPPIVAAIGPTTARTAIELGLQVTHVAADHSVEGLATTIVDALTRPT